jgi:serine protease inhibitor
MSNHTNIRISKILHRTALVVDETGSQASTVTLIEEDEEYKSVIHKNL